MRALVGIRTTARLLTEVTSRPFASAAHLAAHAGLAPVTRRAHRSIRGEHPSRRGNKILKRTTFLSAFAALRDPISQAYHDRKIRQGNWHNQTTRHSSHSPAGAATSCMRCCLMALFFMRHLPLTLDRHTGTHQTSFLSVFPGDYAAHLIAG